MAVAAAEAEGPEARFLRCLIWYWGAGGAGVRFTQRIAARLVDALGPDAVALSLHAANPWLAQARALCREVHVVGGPIGRTTPLRHALSAPLRLFELARLVRRREPDVLIIPMNFTLAWPLAAVPRLMGARLVYVAHDAAPHPGDYLPGVQRWTQKRLLAIADQVACPSDFVRRELADAGGPALARRLAHLPLGGVVEPVAKAPRPAPQGRLRFLFLGRLLRYKGLDLLARALEPLRGRDDWSLTIAGDGRDRAFVLEAFAGFRQVDLSRVAWLPEEEIDALLAAHDVVVCPYLEASQSGVVPEAAAHGLPAIVTPVGALSEQLGEGGWIADGLSAEALTRCLVDALDARAAYPGKSAKALAALRAQRAAADWVGLARGAAFGR